MFPNNVLPYLFTARYNKSGGAKPYIAKSLLFLIKLYVYEWCQ